MLILFEKAIHVFSAVTILGLICMNLASSIGLVFAKKDTLASMKIKNRYVLSLFLVVTFTGVLLVYPRGYTFHTGWIGGAFLLTFVSALLFYWKSRLKNEYRRLMIDGILIILLVLIVHDAVTKTTWLPI